MRNRLMSFIGTVAGSVALLVVPGTFLTTFAPEAAAECMSPQEGDARDLWVSGSETKATVVLVNRTAFPT